MINKLKATPASGNIAALFTMLIWGTTFVSTKFLLTDFNPIEILLFRFILGYGVLWILCPRVLHLQNKREELYFALAGLTGVTLYYLVENVALTYTYASNVGVITSTAPLFTALVAYFFTRGSEKLHAGFFAGFAAAMAGICLISFSGGSFHIDLRGDGLALVAAFFWGCYSNLSKKVAGFGYDATIMTRRIFFWGILFMLPASLFFGVDFSMARLADPWNAFHLLYLGVGASAICFITWNYAVHILGAVRTSAYIYLIPVLTVAFSAVFLHEPITLTTLGGMLLTLFGLYLSEGGFHLKPTRSAEKEA